MKLSESKKLRGLWGEQQAAATIVVTDTLTLPDGLSDVARSMHYLQSVK